MAPTKKNSRRRSNARKSDTPLGAYLGDVSKVDVLKPEEEQRLAAEIADHRVALWKALLSYPPFVGGIVEVLEPALEADKVDELPREELETARTDSRAFRDRETKSNREAYHRAQAGLATAMAEIDLDGKYADMIAADLEAIDANRREGVTLQVTHPPKGSRPFARYIQRVRGANQALRYSKNKFVKANLRLVVTIARRFDHGLMPLQDLVQEGNLGLMKAVDRFDYRKGFRFSTYGSWWIRHAISRAIADKGRQVRLPVHMIDAHHKVTKARRELEAKHGREPTREELAEHTGLNLAKIERMGTMPADNPISIDKPFSDEDGRRFGDFLEDENAEIPGDGLEAQALNEQVKRLVAMLRPIEADIIRKRFGLTHTKEELTLKEIGGQYSLSRERIRQLQEQALGKIRNELELLELLT